MREFSKKVHIATALNLKSNKIEKIKFDSLDDLYMYFYSVNNEVEYKLMDIDSCMEKTTID